MLSVNLVSILHLVQTVDLELQVTIQVHRDKVDLLDLMSSQFLVGLHWS